MNPVRGPTSALTRERGIRINRSNGWPGRNLHEDSNEHSEIQQDFNEHSIENSIENSDIHQNSIENEEIHQNSIENQLIIPPKKTKKSSQKKKRPDSDFSDPEPAGRSKYSKRQKNSMIQFCSRCFRKYLNVQDDFCSACLGFPDNKLNKGKKQRNKILKSDAQMQLSAPSLKYLCIKTVAEYIDHVEEFGDISSEVKRKISMILSRHRQLKTHLIPLFLGPTEDALELFDCAKIDDQGFQLIAYSCPNLVRLNLSLCGRLTSNLYASQQLDEPLTLMGQNFLHLQHLKFTGCFLCTDDAFKVMFETIGSQLQTLELADISKMTMKSFGILKGEALTCLKVKRCEKLGEEFLKHVGTFQSLHTFKFMNTSSNVTSEGLKNLMERIGSKLNVLTLSGLHAMDDKTLMSLTVCQHLKELSLSHCEMITEDGMIPFLNQMNKLGLTKLNLKRLIQLKDESFSLAMKLYGFYLTKLNVNGLDELSEPSLKLLTTKCPSLQDLDCSWVRDLTDEQLESLFSHSKQLQRIKVYGCHRLTECTLNSVRFNEKEARIFIFGNEFD